MKPISKLPFGLCALRLSSDPKAATVWTYHPEDFAGDHITSQHAMLIYRPDRDEWLLIENGRLVSVLGGPDYGINRLEELEKQP